VGGGGVIYIGTFLAIRMFIGKTGNTKEGRKDQRRSTVVGMITGTTGEQAVRAVIERTKNLPLGRDREANNESFFLNLIVQRNKKLRK
jgi:hypothetical protein